MSKIIYKEEDIAFVIYTFTVLQVGHYLMKNIPLKSSPYGIGTISLYRILPIKGASPNKGAPHSLKEANSIINVQIARSFLNNCPIFNPKPPLESSDPQLSSQNIRCDLANAPGALIRQNTVIKYYTANLVKLLSVGGSQM